MKKLFFVSILAIFITLFSCRAIIGLSDGNTGNSSTPSSSTSSGSTPTNNSNQQIIELTSSKDFSEQVEQSKGYVIVDFYKGWCTNCIWVQYAFYQLLKDYPNVKFCSAQAFGTTCTKSSKNFNLYYEEYKTTYANKMDSDFLEHWLNYGCGERHQSCSEEADNIPSSIPFEGGGKNQTPTVLLYKDGKPIARLGATQDDINHYCHTEKTVKEFLEKYVE